MTTPRRPDWIEEDAREGMRRAFGPGKEAELRRRINAIESLLIAVVREGAAEVVRAKHADELPVVRERARPFLEMIVAFGTGRTAARLAEAFDRVCTPDVILQELVELLAVLDASQDGACRGPSKARPYPWELRLSPLEERRERKKSAAEMRQIKDRLRQIGGAEVDAVLGRLVAQEKRFAVMLADELDRELARLEIERQQCEHEIDEARLRLLESKYLKRAAVVARIDALEDDERY